MAVNTEILIAQMTDCHLSADPQTEYRGINPYHKLQVLLQKVETMKPDLLLASGDLSEDGSWASYQALQRFFKPFDIPVLALPGNHDDAGLLAKFFPGSPVEGVSVTDIGRWQIIRLNSCVPGKHEGRLSEIVLAELEHILADHRQRPRLIAIHHQPINIGSPWIDKYRLFDSEGFLSLIDQFSDVKVVVWGHVHQAYESDRSGVAMLGGPSSAINSLPGVQKFTVDASGPACRWIKLRSDGTFQTGIF